MVGDWGESGLSTRSPVGAGTRGNGRLGGGGKGVERVGEWKKRAGKRERVEKGWEKGGKG